MSESLERFREREQQLLCRTYSRYPLSVVRAKGARLWTRTAGNMWICWRALR